MYNFEFGIDTIANECHNNTEKEDLTPSKNVFSAEKSIWRELPTATDRKRKDQKHAIFFCNRWQHSSQHNIFIINIQILFWNEIHRMQTW